MIGHRYVVLPGLDVSSYSLQSSYFTMGIPAPSAFLGFVRKQLLDARRLGIELQAESVLIAVGGGKPHADHKGRALAKRKMAFMGQAPEKKGESIQLPSDIPSFSGDGEFSLIIKVLGEDDRIAEQAKRFADHLSSSDRMMKLAGGVIQVPPKAVCAQGIAAAIEHLPRSHFVVGALPLPSSDGSKIKALFEACLPASPGEPRKAGWRFAGPIGFRRVSPKALKPSSRLEGAEHAFVEPVIGLMNYTAVSRVEKAEDPDLYFWRYANDADHAYLLTTTPELVRAVPFPLFFPSI